MDDTHNHLIEFFPKPLQARFLAHCERFSLVPAVELGAAGQVLRHAYFPDAGRIALVIGAHGRAPMEIGAVGRESMLGSELLLGDVRSPWRAVVEEAGTCWRIDAAALRQAMSDMPALHASLQHNFIVQVHQRQAVASAAAVPWSRGAPRDPKPSPGSP